MNSMHWHGGCLIVPSTRTRSCASVMLQFIIERDLLHLERVVEQACDGTFPFAYWHARIDSLRRPTLALPLAQRIDRLKRKLSMLESTQR